MKPTIRISNQVAKQSRFSGTARSLRLAFWALACRGNRVWFSVDLASFCRDMGLDHWVKQRNLRYLKEQLLAWVGTAFSFEYDQHFSAVPLFQSITLEPVNRVTVVFNNRALELFNNLTDKFAIVRVKDMAAINSARALRMMVLFSYMRHLDNVHARTINVPELRYILDLESPAYDAWQEMRRAIERAMSQVNHAVRGLEFALVPIKLGRKVGAVRFDPVRVARYVNQRRIGHDKRKAA